MLFFFLEQCMVCWSFFFFSSRRRHTRFDCDWSSDVCSSDLHFAGISSQVKLLMGYAAFPGALVMETRKSSGMSFTEAAAAVTDSRFAFTNWPAGFCTLP